MKKEKENNVYFQNIIFYVWKHHVWNPRNVPTSIFNHIGCLRLCFCAALSSLSLQNLWRAMGPCSRMLQDRAHHHRLWPARGSGFQAVSSPFVVVTRPHGFLNSPLSEIVFLNVGLTLRWFSYVFLCEMENYFLFKPTFLIVLVV